MARSAKKGPYVDLKLRKKVLDVKNSGRRDHVKTWSRSCVIIPDFVGSYIDVHNGKSFVTVFVSENMVGHKLGEFAATRVFRAHSGQRQASKGAGAK